MTEPPESGGAGFAGAGAEAVIFDLWETLADFEPANAETMLQDVAARLDLEPADFRRRWEAVGHKRYVGPIEDVLREFGVPDDALDDVKRIRLDYTRRVLVPRPGVVETLRELRRRGKKLGMVSVCSEEVERIWPETQFAGLFDAEVFSCTEGISKPDARAYLSCCEQLGVEPRNAVFVGDGANDELAGAERAGLRAVLIHRPGEAPRWAGLAEWHGARIDAIPQILQLV
ncbi:MAG TPA: HAD family hydrolase [Gaiellaceae bacterium]|nr:HAD family hydrolase [Gaiellaceae bacterium]